MNTQNSSYNRTSGLDRGVVGIDLKIPTIVFIYFIAVLLPVEISFYLGRIYVTPVRLALIFLMIPTIYLFLRDIRKHPNDLFVLGVTIWVCMAYFYRRGFGGLEAIGQSILEILVAYLAARMFVSSGQIKRFVIVIGLIIAVFAILAIPEALFQSRFLHDIPRQITGIYYYISDDTRLNMLRAASTFEHPILFGLFCATFMSLIWFNPSSPTIKFISVSGVLVATTFALSSAPLLLLSLQITLIIAERVTRALKKRVVWAIVLTSLLVVLGETLSNQGVVRFVASNLTFNPHTGFYRILQWDHTIDDVMAHPFLGIEVSQWTRPFWMTYSIDNHWLLFAMNSGIPAVVLTWIIIVMSLHGMYRRYAKVTDTALKHLILGWSIGVIAMFLGGWTVALFGKMYTLSFFFLGLGTTLVRLADVATEPEYTVPAEKVPAQSRYTRFEMRHRSP